MKWYIFGSFNAFSLPNTAWFRWNFHQKYSLIKEFFKILSFSPKRTYPKFTVLHYFSALFSPVKSKILAKTNISPKTTSRTNENQRFLIKLIKPPPIFWAQKWPNLPPGACPKGQHKFSHRLLWDRLSIVSGSISFNFWVFAILDIAFRISLLLLRCDSIALNFWGFWTITLVINVWLS